MSICNPSNVLEDILNNTKQESEGENSSDDLKIVLESPSKRRKSSPILNEDDKLFIESVEEALEEQLNEKAAKSNLNTTNVRNLLKHVVTNEHVLALVRQHEHPDESPSITFEPKLTRAKTKELLSASSSPVHVTPRSNINESSEVCVLLSEELQEDSSGDEYIPGEESEDDRDSSIFSENDPPSVPSIPPTTPTKLLDTSSHTSWTTDGIFKIPTAKVNETDLTSDSATNIALRTRSKFSLSATPLEVIEESFMPPDITTDMYDMDCDDDDWKDFLKTFTRPLDEVTKAAEDEDHDPEYNILADEESDKVDKDELREELREDKAVKVSRKELNNLMAELFEYADMCSSNPAPCKEIEQNFTQTTLQSTTTSTVDSSYHNPMIPVDDEPVFNNAEDEENVLIKCRQIPLLSQQLRQHVQMLTQNFILTYQHPELYHLATQFKENLLYLKQQSEGKTASIFNIINLPPALELLEYWENLFATNSDEVFKTKCYVAEVIAKSIQRRLAGLEYVVTFPKLILETISKSEVFMYPTLLPRIPFRSPTVFNSKKFTTFFPSEDYLIALGMEQFIPFLASHSYNINRRGQVKLKTLCQCIEQYLLPGKNIDRMYRHITDSRMPKAPLNPIKYYYEHKAVPATVHYLHNTKMLPPCARNPEKLPIQWRDYLYPNKSESTRSFNSCKLSPIAKIVKPPVYNKKFTTKKLSKPILPKEPITSTPKTSGVARKRRDTNTTQLNIHDLIVTRERKLQDKFLYLCQRSIPLHKIVSFFNHLCSELDKLDTTQKKCNPNMLPSMPSLLNTPLKHEQTVSEDSNSVRDNGGETIFSTDNLLCKVNDFSEQGTSSQDEMDYEPCKYNVEKDNIDDINALMKASSTIKNTRKEPSGAEKKRIKLRKEFVSNLRMATPESVSSIEARQESFAFSYYNKLQEKLEVQDYHKVMATLSEIDESRADAVDIYNKIIEILEPKYSDLAEQFLVFLNDIQAHAVGKLVPYYMIKNMSLFLQKLDLYFQDKPSQIKKVYKTLTDIGNIENVPLEKLKSQILPLLKGNVYLTDLFAQCFMEEHPPLSFIGNKFETIDIVKDTTHTIDDEVFETITIPDMEDKFGNLNCVCTCHNNSNDVELSTRKKHCVPCGTKYLQGKIFIQTGKGLRPATVRFLVNPKKDHNVRLNSENLPPKKKRSDSSPSKRSTSPMKEYHDEEKEDEGGGKKRTRTKTCRKLRTSKKDKQLLNKNTNEKKNNALASKENCDMKTDNNTKTNKSKTTKEFNVQKKTQKKLNDQCNLDLDDEGDISETKTTQKRPAEESLEIDFNSSAESNELKLSSAESESECYEESSQANTNSDLDDSSDSSVSFEEVVDLTEKEDTSSNDILWTRDEDKIILETFQRERNKENLFLKMSEQLPDRTITQIKCRFQTLITLLHKMASDK